MESLRGPEIIANADLSRLSTFRLPARAAELIVLESIEQLGELPPAEHGELVLGGGSNTVFVRDYPGRIILNRLRGVRFAATGDDVLVSAAAGECWHRLVRRCLDEGLYGIENLVMIPGAVGAAPMQNIGAYGVELAECFESLTARDRRSGKFVTLGHAECAFAYRDSRFKSGDPGRFLITEVTLRLKRRFTPNLRYPSLATELARCDTRAPTPRQLAAAVMRLRRHRLPSPARLPNAGSFFQNPVVNPDIAARLLAEHPGWPHWPMTDGRVKLAAGWMIEWLGWKGQSMGGAGVYDKHALVLVNHGQATPREVLNLIEAIRRSVAETFGIHLQPEPRIVGLPD